VTNCRNCDSTIEEYSDCPYCWEARLRLLERLDRWDEGVRTLAQLASVALHGPQERPERVWRIG
jgi:hypothetical protein